MKSKSQNFTSCIFFFSKWFKCLHQKSFLSTLLTQFKNYFHKCVEKIPTLTQSIFFKVRIFFKCIATVQHWLIKERLAKASFVFNIISYYLVLLFWWFERVVNLTSWLIWFHCVEMLKENIFSPFKLNILKENEGMKITEKAVNSNFLVLFLSQSMILFLKNSLKMWESNTVLILFPSIYIFYDRKNIESIWY